MKIRAVKSAVLVGAVLSTGFGVAALAQQPKASAEKLKRGETLVTVAGCHDCHTPMKEGKSGPEPDMSRALSGHPEGMQLPPPPKPVGPWGVFGALTMTAWHGPWGTTYVANITPDKETGIGAWTEKQFIQALRTGKHQGRGRPILPPMPWMWIGKADDADLSAIFAYLQSNKPIKNRVPQPVPPADAAKGGAK